MTTTRSVADRLVDHALDAGIELFHDQFDSACARLPVGNHFEVLRCKSKHLRRWFSKLFWETERKAPHSEGISSALNVLEAKARFDGKQHALHNRVAWLDGDIWIDLADSEWRAIRVTKAGWSIVPNPPILFARHAHQQPLPEPRVDGEIDRLGDLLNVGSEAHRLLLKIFLVTCFVPDIPHPILIVYGSQGSAKTSLLRMFRALIDPSAMPTLTLPTRPSEFIQQLSHHYFTPYDNLSHLPDWSSDALCRAVTGEGHSKRELYTDDEDIIYSFRRCCALNGINVAAHKPDLLDRAVLIGLERIPREHRRPERELWKEFESLRPEILGAALDLLSAAMRLAPKVGLTQLPRMADFAIWGAAVAEAMGVGTETFVSAFDNNYDLRNQEVLANSPVATALQLFASERASWGGTASELLAELDRLAAAQGINTRTRYWPKAAHILTRRLNELKPNLESAGIEVTTGGSQRAISIRRNTRSSVPSVAASKIGETGAFSQRSTGDPTSTVAPPQKARRLNASDATDARDANSGASQVPGDREVIEL